MSLKKQLSIETNRRYVTSSNEEMKIKDLQMGINHFETDERCLLIEKSKDLLSTDKPDCIITKGKSDSNVYEVEYTIILEGKVYKNINYINPLLSDDEYKELLTRMENDFKEKLSEYIHCETKTMNLGNVDIEFKLDDISSRIIGFNIRLYLIDCIADRYFNIKQSIYNTKSATTLAKNYKER